jgi:hypothetical protein
MEPWGRSTTRGGRVEISARLTRVDFDEKEG